jgi:hypothetical protein
MDDDECGAAGGMTVSVNWSTLRKPALVPLCLPQNPYELPWSRSRAATVESQRLRLSYEARPN